MSSYVVENKTIYRVVTFSYARPEYQAVAIQRGYEVPDPDELDRLAQDLLALNVFAVDNLYREGGARKFRPLDFRFSFEICSPIQALKSLHCLKYQCSEKSAMRVPSYQFLVELECKLMYNIVTDLPEYDKAEWG